MRWKFDGCISHKKKTVTRSETGITKLDRIFGESETHFLTTQTAERKKNPKHTSSLRQENSIPTKMAYFLPTLIPPKNQPFMERYIYNRPKDGMGIGISPESLRGYVTATELRYCLLKLVYR